MYRENINMLKQHEIKIEVGLSSSELKIIEEVYNIRFPKSLCEFLREALPVTNGFYNWRDFSEENISTIKKVIAGPIEALKALAEEVEFGEKKQQDIAYDRIPSVPFWSEIM